MVEAQATGLRERKKERTREALVDAAHELFRVKGFDATTIDEIAGACDVSRRTFFRYFAGKEDAALARSIEVEEAMVVELAARPAAETPLTALRRSFAAVMARVAADPKHAAADFLTERRIIEGSPVLLAATMRHAIAVERRMAAVLAERVGVDPARDTGPLLLVALHHSVIRVAMNAWAEHGASGGPEELVRAVDAGWARLAGTVRDGWTADGGDPGGGPSR